MAIQVRHYNGLVELEVGDDKCESWCSWKDFPVCWY